MSAETFPVGIEDNGSSTIEVVKDFATRARYIAQRALRELVVRSRPEQTTLETNPSDPMETFLNPLHEDTILITEASLKAMVTGGVLYRDKNTSGRQSDGGEGHGISNEEAKK